MRWDVPRKILAGTGFGLLALAVLVLIAMAALSDGEFALRHWLW